MQVSLDAIDWIQLTNFSSPDEFLEWYFDLEDEGEFRSLSCYDNGWDSDSAMQYFEVASALKHLADTSPPEKATHLREGIMKLIAESGHIDEFLLTEPSEGCYWISASPESVASMKNHLDAVDLQDCAASLRNNPPKDADEIMSDLDEMFISFVEQHRRMVDLAVSKGYGLLGHCG
jgi:hypothetical protein